MRWVVVAICLAAVVTAAPLMAQPARPVDTGTDLRAQLKLVMPLEPTAAVKTISVTSGFQMQLVASEPDVRDPIAMAFDADSRLFVVEFPEYNHQHAGWPIVRQGSVRLLEDTNGDGTYDRSTVYVDGLASPTSVACYNGGIIVCAAPDILFCKDTDGDGRADVRQTLFTGFGISENRGGGGRLNSIRWGLDHRFHVCTSFSGGMVRRPGHPEIKPLDVRNRGFAFDPRTMQMEATSGAGQHGLAFDDRGRMFTCRNSDPFRLVMYESRYAARNPYGESPPPEVSIAQDGKFTKLFRRSAMEGWRVVRTQRRVAGAYRGSAEGGTPGGFFTAATGVVVYRGDAWPASYRGNVLVGEVSNNLIHRARLRPAGLSLVAERADPKTEFVASTDNWFRPVELRNGPDGNLYVVDMYRQLIETALALPADVLRQLPNSGGVKRGRIYRIAPLMFNSKRAPRLSRLPTSELVDLLQHRNGWHRDTAARLLFERGDSAAVVPLRRQVSQGRLAPGRIAALYALHGFRALDESVLITALRDRSANVRMHALRLAEERINDSPALQDRLLQLTADPRPQVRYQLAFSLGAVDSARRTTAVVELAAKDVADPWMRVALFSSLAEGAGDAFQRLAAADNFRTTRHGREFLTALAQQIGAANRTNDVVACLQAIDNLPEGERGLSEDWVQALAAKQKGPARRKLLAAAGGRAAEILDRMLKDARQHAADDQRAVEQRVPAIRSLALAGFNDNRELLESFLSLQQPPRVQQAALDTLAEFDDRRVAGIILAAWPRLSPSLRVRATEALLSRPQWIAVFLDAVESGRLQPTEVNASRMNLLKQYPDRTVVARVSRLFADTTLPERQAILKRYQPALKRSGDPQRGRQLFKKVCSSCHRLQGVGTAVGADLRGIRNRDSASILLSILDPNREVKTKFLNYVLQTEDGRVLTGMISSESANNLTLRQADGKLVTVRRVDVEALRNTGISFMPVGLEKQLDLKGMSDLLTYLNSIP